MKAPCGVVSFSLAMNTPRELLKMLNRFSGIALAAAFYAVVVAVPVAVAALGLGWRGGGQGQGHGADHGGGGDGVFHKRLHGRSFPVRRAIRAGAVSRMRLTA